LRGEGIGGMQRTPCGKTAMFGAEIQTETADFH
jgi:hypothetical protein